MPRLLSHLILHNPICAHKTAGFPIRRAPPAPYTPPSLGAPGTHVRPG